MRSFAAPLALVALLAACARSEGGEGADSVTSSGTIETSATARDQASPTTADSGAAPAAADSAAAAGDATGSAAGESATAAAAQTTGTLVDPNTATKEQLAAVPGMTPEIVDALVAGRPYADMRAVDKVLAAQKLDSAARRAVYGRVFKKLDLNKASGEEIVLIPGVGRRMRHEFEEYRPYKDMAQFRREIGKYVDKSEVARLERYVTIGQ